MTTDAEHRDAAVGHLKKTTVGYVNKHWKVPPTGSEWKQGLDELALIGQTTPPPPPPPPPPSGVLGVDRSTMLATGGKIIREDNTASSDPLPLWKQLVAQTPDRLQYMASGGDPGPKADGQPQGNSAYRRFTVVQGDDPGGWGARCALGRNEWQNGDDGTFQLGHEGERKIVFWSMRLTDSYDLATQAWQQVCEWKQCQPYDVGQDVNRGPGSIRNGVGPELQLYAGLLRLHVWWEARVSMPAPPKNKWIRCAWDTVFSQDPARGKISIYCDNDGDGDWNDPDEVMTWAGSTLAYTPDGTNGIPPGGSLHAFFELGPYRNPGYATSTIEYDNVQVMA